MGAQCISVCHALWLVEFWRELVTEWLVYLQLESFLIRNYRWGGYAAEIHAANHSGWPITSVRPVSNGSSSRSGIASRKWRSVAEFEYPEPSVRRLDGYGFRSESPFSRRVLICILCERSSVASQLSHSYFLKPIDKLGDKRNKQAKKRKPIPLDQCCFCL